MGSSKILPLVSRNEFIPRRLTEDNLILPDVDVALRYQDMIALGTLQVLLHDM
jgi:hypothetical protein